MKKFLLIGLILLSTYAQASIRATVNDVPISDYDVNVRYRLLKMQNPNVALFNERAFKRQLLEQLIEEQLKTQEAKKMGLSVPDEEYKQAISYVEKTENIPAGMLTQLLKQNNIPLSAVKNQIYSDLLWMQVLKNNPDAVKEISAKEVAQKKATLMADLKKEGYLVSEIFVYSKENAQKIFEQIQAGAEFPVAAVNYSRALSAKKQGEVGWITRGHYDAAVDRVLQQMKPNELSKPIATKDGYLILFLHEKRPALQSSYVEVLELAQMTFPPALTAKAKEKLSRASGCNGFKKFGEKYAIKGSVRSGFVNEETLPEPVKKLVADAPVKKALGPLTDLVGDTFFMKCSIERKSLLPTDEQIKMQLKMEKVDKLSERLLKEIKRAAVVEYK